MPFINDLFMCTVLFIFQHVLLSKSAKEYIMIEKLFKLTMPLSVINNIQRIQNPSLWKVFQW